MKFCSAVLEEQRIRDGSPLPYVVMAKSLFCSGKPQNHADKSLKQEVQYGIMCSIPESFLKFCSAVLEEQRIRDWEGRTAGRMDERTDIRITIYPCNFICGGYNYQAGPKTPNKQTNKQTKIMMKFNFYEFQEMKKVKGCIPKSNHLIYHFFYNPPSHASYKSGNCPKAFSIILVSESFEDREKYNLS